MSEAAGRYLPGECNLGPEEVSRRIQGGAIGLGAVALVWAFCVALGLPRPVRLVVFFPAFMSAVGFIQAANRFCVGFGLAGRYNFGTPGTFDPVTDPGAHAKDVSKSRLLLLASAGAAAALTALAYFF